jgi:transcriptional regulator GlxA family with amidase domain
MPVLLLSGASPLHSKRLRKKQKLAPRNFLTGTPPVTRFRVTTASVDGRAVRCDGAIQMGPDAAITDIRKTDLIFIPTTGLSLDDVEERNAPVVPWLRRWHYRRAAIASVCSDVGRSR